MTNYYMHPKRRNPNGKRVRLTRNYLWYSHNGTAKRVTADDGSRMYVRLSTWKGTRRQA